MRETPSSTLGEALVDGVIDQLMFLAHFFGKRADPTQLLADTPVMDGRISEAHIHECAQRGGLSLSRSSKTPADFRPSELPALIVVEGGDPLVVLSRKGEDFECVQAGIRGSVSLSAERITAEYPGVSYFVRPRVFFDTRSLLYHLPRPRRWFWDTLLANRAIYGWALLATVLTNVFAAVIPFYTMSVYDRVVPNNALDSLWVLTGAVVVVALFDLVIKMLRSYLLEAAARKADVAMSSHVFAHALRLRAASRPASGGVLANIVRDFESVREFVTSSTLTMLGDVPFMLFFLVLIGLVGHWLVMIPLIMIPLTITASLLIRRPLIRVLGANMQESAQRTAHLFETMNGVDTLKSLGAEAWARRKWEMLTVKISENSVRMREWTSFGTYLSLLVTNLTTILIVMFGALLIAEGELTMGQLIAVSMLTARAITPATQIAALIVRYEQTRQALDALDKIMESPTDESTDSLHLPRMQGRIDFRDTHFAYPESPPLLKGLNLSIRPGERIGFIGRIGSGKSTLFKLLLNLYSPDQGSVLVDGMSVSQLEPQSLRRQVGYVPQDVVLFHGDIRENILLGNAQAGDAQLLEALRLSCLDETLAQMPHGLGTQVGERGDRLSGGQRQAVSIARALVQQPRMLLLDEPSSMMDPGTESRLIENLRSIKGITLLLVTHRMAMLPLVDRLVVLDQGRVVLDGPRADVLRKLQGGPTQATPKEYAA
ncbi:type I secretion system permease/ATPase [Zoogloea sp.]|uniref:type I secretion system permease/ATPase n=1 Tax=Zoogloea sp. TaxID=49181 RepID=UPI001AD15A33|nr:type I secretion system permease/ATPase [Zoogloea sp.]MBN8284332.1 type I secretion system permease/ATPase [Zoogloea sp.]